MFDEDAEVGVRELYVTHIQSWPEAKAERATDKRRGSLNVLLLSCSSFVACSGLAYMLNQVSHPLQPTARCIAIPPAEPHLFSLLVCVLGGLEATALWIPGSRASFVHMRLTRPSQRCFVCSFAHLCLRCVFYCMRACREVR